MGVSFFFYYLLYYILWVLDIFFSGAGEWDVKTILHDHNKQKNRNPLKIGTVTMATAR